MKFFITAFFFLKLTIFSLILGQAANIQILPHKRLDNFKKIQFFKTITVQARRGKIADRTGKELAINKPTFSLFADPKFVKNPRWTANQIARPLGMNPRNLERKMRKNSRFVWLRRRLNLDLKDKIMKLGITGLHFVSESKRTYPSEQATSSILGFIGSDGQGLEGLEYQYNKFLTGKDVELKISRDAKGRPLFIDAEQYINPPEGHDLRLSIDSEYQGFLEMQLKRAYNEHKPKAAFGVILDVTTGSVRAVAQWTGRRAFRSEYNKNLVFQESQEQGSTIKPFAIAAALDNGVFNPNSRFPCLGGKIKIGRRTISDSKKLKCTEMSLTEGLKVSSNVVLTQMALEVGEKKLRLFYNGLGFGKKTKIDFPGEARGIYNSEKWPGHMVPSASFGHGFTATPIQVAVAYSAIANGGILNQPHMVEEIKSPTGLKTKIATISRRVMKKSTADTLKAMLTEVTQSGGTGTNAAVEGYLVAGKTGTANKVNLENGGYYKDKYMSSFVGLVPADRPRFVVYIGLDEPSEKYYASDVAAPVFSRVSQFILTKENVAPTRFDSDKIMKCVKDECGYRTLTDVTKKDLKGLTLREALRVLKKRNIKAQFVGQGLVSAIRYENGVSLENDSRITVFMN